MDAGGCDLAPEEFGIICRKLWSVRRWSRYELELGGKVGSQAKTDVNYASLLSSSMRSATMMINTYKNQAAAAGGGKSSLLLPENCPFQRASDCWKPCFFCILVLTEEVQMFTGLTTMDNVTADLSYRSFSSVMQLLSFL